MKDGKRKMPGASYFKDLSRKDYVVKAGEIIQKEGLSAISIRRIAAELGCSSASMYRYFKNLDELLFYVHLGALNEYILDLSKREKEWKDIWDLYFGIWQSYAGEAFKNPVAFELVFYRNLDKDLGQAIKEYYDMFPQAIVLVETHLKVMLETPGYYERDYLVCAMLVKEGKITLENARKLNHVVCTLFLGYFKYVQEKGVSQGQIPPMVDRFMEECREIAAMYAGASGHEK